MMLNGQPWSHWAETALKNVGTGAVEVRIGRVARTESAATGAAPAFGRFAVNGSVNCSLAA